jgi:hypothetical protein
MEIAGETWLQLADGRLISVDRQVAGGLLATGATEIPPERVEPNEAGTGYVLLPEPKTRKKKNDA